MPVVIGLVKVNFNKAKLGECSKGEQLEGTPIATPFSQQSSKVLTSQHLMSRKLMHASFPLILLGSMNIRRLFYKGTTLTSSPNRRPTQAKTLL